MSGLEYKLVLSLVSPSVSEIEGIKICHWEASFLEDVPLVEFMYLVFTHMPDESY